jgi:hypothetical protein
VLENDFMVFVIFGEKRHGLSFIFIEISILFIIVGGIEFGDFKTQKWLKSLLIGFFSSISLTQPIKVNHFLLKKSL